MGKVKINDEFYFEVVGLNMKLYQKYKGLSKPVGGNKGTGQLVDKVRHLGYYNPIHGFSAMFKQVLSSKLDDDTERDINDLMELVRVTGEEIKRVSIPSKRGLG